MMIIKLRKILSHMFMKFVESVRMMRMVLAINRNAVMRKRRTNRPNTPSQLSYRNRRVKRMRMRRKTMMMTKLLKPRCP